MLGFFDINDLRGRKTEFIVFEPLGKTLQILMDEAAESGGLPLEVIKEVARHILTALQFIVKTRGIIHADIKPSNIATQITQRSLGLQLKNILDTGKSLEPFRMLCQKNLDFEGRKRRTLLNEIIQNFDIPGEVPHSDSLVFVLIDFGNCQVNFLNKIISLTV